MNIGTQNTESKLFDFAMLDHRGKIVVSSSHNDTRFMMRVLLEMWGYEVIEADGEEETVQAAERFLPNAILVDTTRAFDDELKIVSRLRVSTLLRMVPIFVLSGFTQAQNYRAA